MKKKKSQKSWLRTPNRFALSLARSPLAMISPRLSFVASPSSAAAITHLVSSRSSRALVSCSRAAAPKMPVNRGQANRVVVLASAAAAASNNENDNHTDNPSTSTSNTNASAAIAAAASLAVDEFVRSGDVVAVGPGELPAAVLLELARRLESGKIRDVRVVAAGDAPAAEAAVAGVPQVRLPAGNGPGRGGSEESTTTAIPDVAILQADEVDRNDLSFIACRHDDGVSSLTSTSSSSGGGALPQPQLARVAAAVAAAEARRGTVALLPSPLMLVDRLTGDVPVAVELEFGEDGQLDWEEAAEELDDEFLGDAALGVWRRPSASGLPRTHPRGGDNPHAEVTIEGGTTLLDVRFGRGNALSLLGDGEAPYGDVLGAIEGVEGVSGCGLFCRGVAAVVVVSGDGDGMNPKVLRRGA